jgi:RNA polymerase sigma factor (sigma-70 family)
MTQQRLEDGMEREARFEALFRAHLPRVRAYVARRVADGVEDAVAETFTVAWRRLDDVPADPLPWLLGVARRVLANQHRSARRRQSLVERLRGAPPEVVIAAEDDPRADAVRAALAALRERDREILLLVECDGLGREEVAQALGVSRAEVRVRLHRARGRFAARYEAARPADPAPGVQTRQGASNVHS